MEGDENKGQAGKNYVQYSVEGYMHMKDVWDVDGVPLLLKAAARHGDTSDIHIERMAA